MGNMATDRQDGVTIVTLERGVTNAVNPALVEELAETVGRLRDDEETRAVVLRSANDKFFMIGWDIPELISLSPDGFAQFFKSFNRMCIDLYTLPKPTVAAITGHATAGGCVLALCCDYRLIAEGRKLMGLNEVKLGVPIPYPADCMLRAQVGDRVAREIAEGGDFHGPGQMHRFGMVDDVLPLEEVLPRSMEKAAALGALPAQALAQIKRDRTDRVEARIRAGLDAGEEAFLRCWHSDEAQARIREAAKKF